MRRTETIAATLVIFALACSGDVPTNAAMKIAPSAASRGESRAEADSREISGKCRTTVVSLVYLSPTLARQVVTGPCWISHLGLTTSYLRQVIDFSTLTAVSEEVTFTAANGDVLRATSITMGTPTGPTTFSLAGTFTFIGGTGRFAHASGSAPFVGSVDFATGQVSSTLRGRILYRASDRDDDSEESE